MKPSAWILVFVALFSAGCGSLLIHRRPLSEVMMDYRSIVPGLTEDEVMNRLGAPHDADRQGNLHWRQEGNYSYEHADLYVTLDGEGRVLTTRVHLADGPPPADIPSGLVNPPSGPAR